MRLDMAMGLNSLKRTGAGGGGAAFGGHATLTDNLVSVYKLDEESGSRFPVEGYDWWGELTDTNTVGSDTGFQRDLCANPTGGTSEHLSASSIWPLMWTNSVNGCTFFHWVNILEDDHDISVSISGITHGNWVRCNGLTEDTPKVTAGVRLPGWSSAFTEYAVPNGGWNMVGIRQINDGDSSVVELWINGVMKQDYGPHAFFGSALVETGGDFTIGGAAGSSSNRTSRHQDYYHWDRSLTDGEISDLWNGGEGLLF